MSNLLNLQASILNHALDLAPLPISADRLMIADTYCPTTRVDFVAGDVRMLLVTNRFTSSPFMLLCAADPHDASRHHALPVSFIGVSPLSDLKPYPLPKMFSGNPSWFVSRHETGNGIEMLVVRDSTGKLDLDRFYEQLMQGYNNFGDHWRFRVHYAEFGQRIEVGALTLYSTQRKPIFQNVDPNKVGTIEMPANFTALSGFVNERMILLLATDQTSVFLLMWDKTDTSQPKRWQLGREKSQMHSDWPLPLEPYFYFELDRYTEKPVLLEVNSGLYPSGPELFTTELTPPALKSLQIEDLNTLIFDSLLVGKVRLRKTPETLAPDLGCEEVGVVDIEVPSIADVTPEYWLESINHHPISNIDSLGNFLGITDPPSISELPIAPLSSMPDLTLAKIKAGGKLRSIGRKDLIRRKERIPVHVGCLSDATSWSENQLGPLRGVAGNNLIFTTPTPERCNLNNNLEDLRHFEPSVAVSIVHATTDQALQATLSKISFTAEQEDHWADDWTKNLPEDVYVVDHTGEVRQNKTSTLETVIVKIHGKNIPIDDQKFIDAYKSTLGDLNDNKSVMVHILSACRGSATALKMLTSLPHLKATIGYRRPIREDMALKLARLIFYALDSSTTPFKNHEPDFHEAFLWALKAMTSMIKQLRNSQDTKDSKEADLLERFVQSAVLFFRASIN